MITACAIMVTTWREHCIFDFYFKIRLPFLQSATAPEQHFFHASSNFNHSPKWSLPLIEHTQACAQFDTIKVGVGLKQKIVSDAGVSHSRNQFNMLRVCP